MKKVLIVLLAMLVMALAFSLVSCDEDETDGSGAGSSSAQDSSFDDGAFGADFDELYPDFNEIFGSGGIELPDHEFE